MNQDTINLMKTILQMETAIQKNDKQMSLLMDKFEATDKEQTDLNQQLKDNIKKLSITLNQ